MKPRTVIILAAVFAALLAAYYFTLQFEQHTQIQKTLAKRLYTFQPDDVQSITIKCQGEPATTAVQETPGKWKITEPYSVPPNNGIWDHAAKAIAELSNEGSMGDSTGDLAQYGLADPVVTAHAKTKNQEIDIQFGAQDPTQKFRYARVGKDPVFLVSPDTYFELNRSLLWLRDRYLIDNATDPKSHVDYLEFARMRVAKQEAPATQAPEAAPKKDRENETWEESVSVVVQRDADGTWHMVKPVQGLADQAAVEKLANEVQFAVGRDYVDRPESLTDYGLDPPKARITVRCGSAQPQTLFLGLYTKQGEEGGVFVTKQGAPSVCVIDAEITTLIPESPDAFLDKRLLTHKAADIRKIQYAAGAQKFTLENDEGRAWKLTDPPTSDSDQAAVSHFVGCLVSAKGATFDPTRKPEFGLDAPDIRISVTYAGIDKPAEILVGKSTADGAGFYVTQDTGAVTTLTKSEVDSLRTSAADFISKALLTFKKDSVTQVLMVFEGVAYNFEKGEQAWLIRDPKGKMWESPSDMDALLEAFSHCNAEQVEAKTAPSDRAGYGLLHPTLSVRITLKPEKGAGVAMLGPLEVGELCKDNPHQRYATVAGRSELFRVNQSVIESVRESLRGIKDLPAPSPIPQKPGIEVHP